MTLSAHHLSNPLESTRRAPEHAGPESMRQVPVGVWLFLAAFACNVLSGQSHQIGLPISLDRLLFPAAFLLTLLDPRRAPLRTDWLHVAMTAFVLLSATSWVFHGGTSDTTSAFGLLDRILMPFLLFTLAPVVLATPVRRRLFLVTLTVVGAYLAVTMIAETVRLDALVFPRFIVDAKAASLASGEPARAGGPFLSGEAGGMAVAMCGVGALLLAVLGRRERRPALVVGTLCLAATVGSLTRSVWLGTFLAVASVLVTRRELRRFIPAALIGLLTALTLGAALFPDVAANVVDRVTTSRSLYDRDNTNVGALRAIAEHPLLGIGWGQFLTHGTEWVRQADSYPLTTVDIEIHNVFLSRLAELGVPVGLVFIGVVLAGPVRAFLRPTTLPDHWRAAAGAIFVIWVVPSMTSPIPYPFPNFVMWTVTGVLYAHSARRSPRNALVDSGVEDPQGRP